LELAETSSIVVPVKGQTERNANALNFHRIPDSCTHLHLRLGFREIQKHVVIIPELFLAQFDLTGHALVDGVGEEGFIADEL
jgi:hypothetical protein